jgi:hypothetical protein
VISTRFATLETGGVFRLPSLSGHDGENIPNIATLGLILTAGSPLCAVAESLGRENGLATRVGTYHWAGKHAKGVDSGVRDLFSLNAHIARIALSARMDIDYNRGKDCIDGFSLPSALEDEDVRRTLVHPA